MEVRKEKRVFRIFFSVLSSQEEVEKPARPLSLQFLSHKFWEIDLENKNSRLCNLVSGNAVNL